MNGLKPTSGDFLHAGLRGVIGMVPLIGAPAVELLSLLVASPLEKRREAWLKALGERLIVLEKEEKINLQNLQNNDQFINIVIEATQISIKTSEKEKLKHLKNAIINTAIGQAPDEVKSQIFLSLLDRFTGWHIKILHFFQNPIEWYKGHSRGVHYHIGGSLMKVIKEAFPELQSQNDLLELIWDDLSRAGMHRSTGLMTMLSNESLEKRTTPLADEFLRFIQNDQTSV
jgi:hypothetical protein